MDHPASRAQLRVSLQTLLQSLQESLVVARGQGDSPEVLAEIQQIVDEIQSIVGKCG